MNNNSNNNNNNNNELNLKCPIHNKENKFICETCNDSLICNKCISTLHRGHFITSLEEINEPKINLILNEFNEKFSNIQEQFQISIEQLDQLNEINQQINETTKNDDSIILEIIKEIEGQIEKLKLNSLNSIKENQLNNQLNYSKLKDQLIKKINLFEFLLNKIKNHEDTSSDSSNNSSDGDSDSNSNSIYNNSNNSNIHNNNERINKIGLKLSEILYFNNICKSSNDNNQNTNSLIKNYRPIDNSDIISKCEDVKSKITITIESKSQFYKLPEELNRLPKYFKYGDKLIPYYYNGYIDYSDVDDTSIAINFKYCKDLSFDIRSNINEIHFIEGRCDQFLNSNQNRSIKFHFYNCEILSPIINPIRNEYHFHSFILSELFSTINLEKNDQIHIYNLKDPISSNSINGKEKSLYIHEDYQHPFDSNSFSDAIKYLILYNLKQPLTKESIPNNLLFLNLSGYDHSFKDIIPDHIKVYNYLKNFKLYNKDEYW